MERPAPRDRCSRVAIAIAVLDDGLDVSPAATYGNLPFLARALTPTRRELGARRTLEDAEADAEKCKRWRRFATVEAAFD